jgi:5-methylcytosine-specific restriction endonuclease McrA
MTRKRHRYSSRTSKRSALSTTNEKYKVIKRYKLSPEELLLLKDEIVEFVPIYLEKRRRKLDQFNEEHEKKRRALEGLLTEVDIEVFRPFHLELDELFKERGRLSRELKSASALSVRRLFNPASCDKDAEAIQRTLAELQEKIERVLRAGKIAVEDKQMEVGLRAQMDKLLAEPFEYDWTKEIDTADVLRKEIVFKGERRILGSERELHYGNNEIFAAIGMLLKDAAEKRKLEELKAKASGSEKEMRKLAQSVRRRIANQFKMLSVCPYCGQLLDINDAHADHIYPVSKGGQSSAKNMVYVCSECNQKKSASTLNQFIKNTGLDRSAIEKRLEILGKEF